MLFSQRANSEYDFGTYVVDASVEHAVRRNGSLSYYSEQLSLTLEEKWEGDDIPAATTWASEIVSDILLDYLYFWMSSCQICHLEDLLCFDLFRLSISKDDLRRFDIVDNSRTRLYIRWGPVQVPPGHPKKLHRCSHLASTHRMSLDPNIEWGYHVIHTPSSIQCRCTKRRQAMVPLSRVLNSAFHALRRVLPFLLREILHEHRDLWNCYSRLKKHA